MGGGGEGGGSEGDGDGGEHGVELHTYFLSNPQPEPQHTAADSCENVHSWSPCAAHTAAASSCVAWAVTGTSSLLHTEPRVELQPDVVVEQHLDLLGAADDARARVAVLDHRQLERLPVGEHLVERLLERELLARGAGNLLEGCPQEGKRKEAALGRQSTSLEQ